MKYVIAIFEYAIGLVMVLGGVLTATSEVPPRATASGIAELMVSPDALIIWGILFTVAGLGLLYGKITKQKRVHLHSLMAIYILCFAALIAELAYSGLTFGILDELVIGLIAGLLWLRWKQAYYYIPTDPTKIVDIT